MPSHSPTLIVPGMTRQVVADPNRHKFINRLLSQSLLSQEDWAAAPPRTQRRVLEAAEESAALGQLVEHGLLTKYQAGRIEAGTTFGLVLGRYRLLERLGAGGMAVVFKAEHMDLRHHVAVKVLPPPGKEDHALESRFFSEMRIIARLRHPNIVAATDAGRATEGENGAVLRYLVMEYVPGLDLEEAVNKSGPMSPDRACAIAYQVASALGETHKFGLVHRDIKPSNVMLTAEDQVKLLDFGLIRNFGNRMTAPGTVLGTIEYMAPEQARDARTVDIRADLFGLGGTLYWCLTGQSPFPFDGSNPVEALARRQSASAPSVRSVAPTLSPELDAVVSKMMALRPAERYPDPAAVMEALMPFVHGGAGVNERLAPRTLSGHGSNVPPPDPGAVVERFRILVVDDEGCVRELCRQVLEAEGAVVEVAGSGPQGLALAAKEPFDLVMLDVSMPGMNGVEALGKFRQADPHGHGKVMMISGRMPPDELGETLARGADDFLAKPFSISQLVGRVQNLLRLKSAQDQAAKLNRQLVAANRELVAGRRDPDGTGLVDAMVTAVARLIDQREGRGPGHPARLRAYCRLLAEAARPEFPEIDPRFIDLVERCAPLHDIGRIGLPDHVLLKSGPLTPEERLTMETHTTIAADALRDMEVPDGPGRDFVVTAVQVARHHHERHDGGGYPDKLAGDAIPLAARLVALADTYDALRCRRLYKPALSHAAAVEIIGDGKTGQFDPVLVAAFQKSAAKFEAVFAETPD